MRHQLSVHLLRLCFALCCAFVVFPNGAAAQDAGGWFIDDEAPPLRFSRTTDLDISLYEAFDYGNREDCKLLEASEKEPYLKSLLLGPVRFCEAGICVVLWLPVLQFFCDELPTL